MILSIHQPSYFPWLGLLHKIARSDAFLVLDDVQLSDSGFQNRNTFLTSSGQTKYLSIPFNRRDYLKRPFRDLEIADPAWREKHWNFIHNNYRSHPYFADIAPILEEYYSVARVRLADAVTASMEIALALFGIGTRFLHQSEAGHQNSLRKTDLIVDLARTVGADCYLSGVGAKSYLDEAAFGSEISVRYDRFEHPVYRQLNSAVFVPGLSSLDALFNLGIEGARSLLREPAV